ncbi:response regulator transcription factor [Curvibacter sp. RS43]|uniref:response regulator transcription factor n=1 Tax=Curvibacter microcysteis TaxID=3026419 RepID=UPI00235FC562|nr:response regulator transcription factor [Curvibacter sp. RS43]MDD0812688.1 response regulator transcription factor [Curvibacter sp. RS43]
MPLTDVVAQTGPLDIIVVEDHDLVRLELVDFLSRPGVQVRGADDGEVLESLLRQRHADILVMDLNLPGEDGLSLCRRMRHAFPEIGLIMLTARVMPSDKTAGYQSGADVYLTKPPNVGELEAVIANLARRIRRRVANGLQLDVPRQQLTLPTGAVTYLTLLESRLLYELALAPERKLSTEVLMLRLDPRQEQPRMRGTLPVTISRLRQKMVTASSELEAIKAVRGIGYQLTVAITVRA